MTQFSMGWATGSTGDGASPYTQAQTTDFFRRMFVGDQHAEQGVLPGFLNALAVSSGAADQVTVATGGAIVYGFPYVNDASTNLAIVRPVVNTTGGRVVLRADWAAQTVRAAVVRNTDGVSAIPALTQSAGTTWEIPLATFTINTSGVVTLTDVRAGIRPPMGWPSSRQGGNTTDWGAQGTTNYFPETARVEVGTVRWSGAAAATGSAFVTFKESFPGLPIVIVTPAAGGKIIANILQNAGDFTIAWNTSDGTTRTQVDFGWMAIGGA